MSQESELHRLEQFVEKLLARFTDLRAEKRTLEQDLLESELLVEELQSKISTKDTERSEISNRVNKIVDQIEEWEQSLDNDVTEENDSTSEVMDAEDLDSLGEEDSKEGSDGEDEGRVQHNLFLHRRIQRINL